MRLFIAATLAASLFATNILAAEVAPLAAGKPAGVSQAQGMNDTALIALGVVGGIAAIVAISSSSKSIQVTTPPTTV